MQKNDLNGKYWADRAERRLKEAEYSAQELLKRTRRLYGQSLKIIEREINAFYGKYAKDNKITFEEARRVLSPNEQKRSRQILKEIIENSTDPNKDDLKNAYTKLQITRLDDLQINIRAELEKFYTTQQINFKDGMIENYKDMYYKNTFDVQQRKGFGTDFTRPNFKAIEKAVSQKWLGANYSDRIWSNKERLVQKLDQHIPQGFAMGRNPKETAKILAKDLKVSYNQAEVLARTEFLNIANEVAAETNMSAGIEEYEINATLDDRTSKTCQDLDGKRFFYKDKKVGVNYPPLHPDCRSVALAYFPPDEIEKELGIVRTRLAKGKDKKYYEVPADMTYHEWMKERGNLE